MKHYIFTRFSILDFDAARRTFRHAKLCSSEEEYTEKLFSKDRLDFKFSVFEKVTLNGFTKQTSQNFEWYIFASYYLPDTYKEKFAKLLNPFKNINVIYVKTFDEFYYSMDNIIKDQPEYSTTRIDDDDGMRTNFVELLDGYNNELEGTIISFPYGKRFKLENDDVVIGSEIYYRCNSMGLTAIKKNIWSCGNHVLVGRTHKVIFNDLKDSYLVCCSEYCESEIKSRTFS